MTLTSPGEVIILARRGGGVKGLITGKREGSGGVDADVAGVKTVVVFKREKAMWNVCK